MKSGDEGNHDSADLRRYGELHSLSECDSGICADVSADTLNLDSDQVERKIGPHTRAILPVDYAGHPADLDPILELAKRKGLTVIEDACHALGAEYRGRRVGSIADMTVFSFHLGQAHYHW